MFVYKYISIYVCSMYMYGCIYCGCVICGMYVRMCACVCILTLCVHVCVYSSVHFMLRVWHSGLWILPTLHTVFSVFWLCDL